MADRAPGQENERPTTANRPVPDGNAEPPSLNGDNGSPLLLERLLRLFPPTADPNR